MGAFENEIADSVLTDEHRMLRDEEYDGFGLDLKA